MPLQQTNTHYVNFLSNLKFSLKEFKLVAFLIERDLTGKGPKNQYLKLLNNLAGITLEDGRFPIFCVHCTIPFPARYIDFFPIQVVERETIPIFNNVG